MDSGGCVWWGRGLRGLVSGLKSCKTRYTTCGFGGMGMVRCSGGSISPVGGIAPCTPPWGDLFEVGGGGWGGGRGVGGVWVWANVRFLGGCGVGGEVLGAFASRKA